MFDKIEQCIEMDFTRRSYVTMCKTTYASVMRMKKVKKRQKDILKISLMVSPLIAKNL
jgi:hypothetical protein